MRNLIIVAIASLFVANVAFADASCEAKAVSKDGKPLAGAAKAASIKKCEKDAGAAAPASSSCEAQGRQQGWQASGWCCQGSIHQEVRSGCQEVIRVNLF